MKKNLLGLFVLVLVAVPAFSQQYDVKRENEAPITFKLIGVEINEGSSLQRESVLLNDPDCPVQLIRARLRFADADGRLEIITSTHLSFVQSVAALEVRHILYDVFGRHMMNLSNLQVRDFPAKPNLFSATWRPLEENVTTELLTTVTYVARVRLEDGSQWVHDLKSLATMLGDLQLEKTIGEDAE
jgi:hypothetical protein